MTCEHTASHVFHKMRTNQYITYEDAKILGKHASKQVRHITNFALKHPQYFTEEGLKMAKEYLDNDKKIIDTVI